MGYWYSGWNSDKKDEVVSAAKGFKSWAQSSSGDTSRSYINGDVIGMVWLGTMVQNSGAADKFIQQYINSVNNDGIPNTKYVQYCESGDPAKTVGIIFDTTGGRDTVDNAMKTWSKGQCWNTNTGTVTWNDETLCFLDYSKRKKGNTEPKVGTCDYIKVTSGMNLADATGVTSDAIELYNPNLDFSKLAVNTPVCYSIGNHPDLRVKKNSNGKCATYYVKKGETCSSIAANYYPLSTDNIESYNKKTYGWKGCSNLQLGSAICISDGNPPRPVANPKAECGPLAPGDKYNSECPLNACCDDYGFCGLTSEFCDVKSSKTGAPGTKNCYSNCGVGDLPSGTAGSFEKITYWMDEDKDNGLYYNPDNINDFDIVHYSFVPIDQNFNIDFSKVESSGFLNISAKKVISFGGWDFSTDSSTYMIFRNLAKASEGVQKTFAYKIVNFLQKHELYGVDFDWEYPGAQDIPGIPADDKNNGKNFLSLLKIIKKQLGNDFKLSVALPSSYWYAKAIPIKDMEEVVDYFTIMTYDLYGQWTYGKSDTGLICHTDKTKISNIIKMYNKAGLNFNKYRGGLANYARTYQVGTTNCIDGSVCGFTGPSSNAKAGPYSNTPGIMTEYELMNISSSDIVKKWKKDDTECTYMLYYKDNWAAWSDENQRNDLTNWFKGMGFGGTTLWSVNYNENNKFYDSQVSNTVNDTTVNLEAKEKSISFSVKRCHTSTCKKADELVAEFKSIGLNYNEKYLSFYLKIIELYELYPKYFHDSMEAVVSMQKGVISGLLSQTIAHVKDGKKQYTEFYYKLFLSIFPYPVYDAKNTYEAQDYIFNQAFTFDESHWAHIDSNTRALIEELFDNSSEVIHDELRKRSNKRIFVDYPSYVDYLTRAYQFMPYIETSNNDVIDNLNAENTTIINALDQPMGDSTIDRYYDFPDIEDGSGTGTSGGGTYPSDLSNYQNIVGNLYFSDISSVNEHAFDLLKALRASENEELSDCDIYIYNIAGNEEQATSNALIFLNDNYDFLVERGAIVNVDEKNKTLRCFMYKYGKNGGKSDVDRGKTTRPYMPEKGKDRDEQPPAIANLRNVNLDDRIRITRVSLISPSDNRRQGGSISRRFHNNDEVAVSYRFGIPFLKSYDYGDKNILDYARELEHKVKYGKCECVLIYLPSGSKIFENAPAAERRT